MLALVLCVTIFFFFDNIDVWGDFFSSDPISSSFLQLAQNSNDIILYAFAYFNMARS